MNSKEKYWGNGAPLGRGPTFEQDDNSVDENEEELIKRFQQEMSDELNYDPQQQQQSQQQQPSPSPGQGQGQRQGQGGEKSNQVPSRTKTVRKSTIRQTKSPSIKSTASPVSASASGPPAPSSSQGRVSTNKPHRATIAEKGTPSSSITQRQTIREIQTNKSQISSSTSASHPKSGRSTIVTTTSKSTTSRTTPKIASISSDSQIKSPSQMILEDDEHSDVSDMTSPEEFGQQGPPLSLHLLETNHPLSSSNVSSVRESEYNYSHHDEILEYNPVSSVSVTYSQSKAEGR